MTIETMRQQSILDTLAAVWSRRKWLAILAFVIPLTAGVSLVVFLPNLYRSVATVLVDRQQVPESFVRSTVTSALDVRLQAISQEVLSRARLEGLIDRFDLYADLRKHGSIQEAVARMRGDIKLELKSAELRGLREATVAFTIAYQGHEPHTVALVTNTLASFYNEENMKARERQASGTADFLKTQLTETKARLDEQEQRVSGFKRRHLGELPQQMDTNLQTLDRLHAQLRDNADRQTRAVERRQALSSQLAEWESLPAYSPASTPAGAPVAMYPMRDIGDVARLEQELAQKRAELEALRRQFTDRYPDVSKKAAEVAQLEQELELAKTRQPKTKTETNPTAGPLSQPSPSLSQSSVSPYSLRLKEALSDVQTELKVLKTEEGRLRESIASYQTRVDNVPRREQEFKELSRDYESTRELYGSLLKRYEEAQLAESLEQRQKGEQFKVVDPARPEPAAAAPNRARLLILAIAASIGLAVGAVVLAEQIDTSFHDLDELRAFSNVPVLISIPRIVTRTDSQRRRWRMRLAATAALVGLVAIVGIGYVAAHGNERLVALLARVAS